MKITERTWIIEAERNPDEIYIVDKSGKKVTTLRSLMFTEKTESDGTKQYNGTLDFLHREDESAQRHLSRCLDPFCQPGRKFDIVLTPTKDLPFDRIIDCKLVACINGQASGNDFRAERIVMSAEPKTSTK